MGVDLSKAFDCIDRGKLIQVLEQQQIASEDELRLIQYLISDTKLQVKLGQTYGEKFQTVIGTPQGDALSPMLFLIYLEQIIRTANLEQRLAQRDVIYAYADDVNFATIEADEAREETRDETRDETRERGPAQGRGGLGRREAARRLNRHIRAEGERAA